MGSGQVVAETDGWHCTRTGKVVYRKRTPSIWRWSDTLRVASAMHPPVNLEVVAAFRVVLLLVFKLAQWRVEIPLPRILERLAFRTSMFTIFAGFKRLSTTFEIDFDNLLLDYLGLVPTTEVIPDGGNQRSV